MKKSVLFLVAIFAMVNCYSQQPKTFEQLEAASNQVKNEIMPGANTPYRVGGLFLDIVKKMEQNIAKGGYRGSFPSFAYVPTETTSASFPYGIEVSDFIHVLADETQIPAGRRTQYTALSITGTAITWAFDGVIDSQDVSSVNGETGDVVIPVAGNNTDGLLSGSVYSNISAHYYVDTLRWEQIYENGAILRGYKFNPATGYPGQTSTALYTVHDSIAGLMSPADKAKLDSVTISKIVTTDEEQSISGYKIFANQIGLPNLNTPQLDPDYFLARQSGGSGKVVGLTIEQLKGEIGQATGSVEGLMSINDKSNLDNMINQLSGRNYYESVDDLELWSVALSLTYKVGKRLSVYSMDSSRNNFDGVIASATPDEIVIYGIGFITTDSIFILRLHSDGNHTAVKTSDGSEIAFSAQGAFLSVNS